MSDVIKRGRLEVRKKNLFVSAYKNRCVLLRNSIALNCKVVEILEGEEEHEESKDVIRLNDVWTVQDKPHKNKGRYMFELVKGDEVILTFACSSVMEREEWTESFRILNQLALPCETAQGSKPQSDYFEVTLLKNRNAVEINHSGCYLLSITDSAIVLHWKTGAIAHHWPKRGVVKFLHHPRKEGHLILHAKRSGTEDVVDFEFTTTPDNSMQILKTWNIRLLESITFNPQQINQIASVLNTGTLPSSATHKRRGVTGSKSFKHPSSVKSPRDDPRDDPLRRADSFSKLHSYRTDINGSVGPGTMSQGNVRIGGLPPLPQEALLRVWGGTDDPSGGALGNLSQDSFFTHGGGPPPPLPPRPSPHRVKSYSGGRGDDEDSDDPDYAYIKEDEVQGPPSSEYAKVKKQRPSISVDDALQLLEQDIMRDNRLKKKGEEERKRSKTLGRPASQQLPLQLGPPASQQLPLQLGPRVHFPRQEPQDYTDFVPSKRSQIKSTSSEPDKPHIPAAHFHSVSEPDTRVFSSSPAKMSQPPVFESSNEDIGSSDHTPPGDHTPSDYSVCAPRSTPSLPPRTWRNTSSSSFGSGSLSTSVEGVVLSGEGVSPTSDGIAMTMSDGSGPTSPGLQATPTFITPDKENKAPPTTIPEETLPISTDQTNADSASQGADHTPQEGDPATPPPLPPRSPGNKEKLSRKSSNSSNSSSSSGRCPRCRSIRKSSISKTVSLDHRTAIVAKGSHDNCRKSMSDLEAESNNATGVKGHRHSHHSHCSKCSPVSSTDALLGGSSTELLQGGSSTELLQGGSSTELLQQGGHPPQGEPPQGLGYLELVSEGPKGVTPASHDIDNELRPEMDLLDSCLQTLEYLEEKVKTTPTADKNIRPMTSAVSNSTPSPPGQWAATRAKTRADARNNTVYKHAKKEAELTLAELSQPLTSHVQGGHQMEGSRQVANGHIPRGQTSYQPGSPRKRGNHNGMSAPRMPSNTPPLSAMGHAPPVPPRSMVSLTNPNPGHVRPVNHIPPSRTHSTSHLPSSSQAPPLHSMAIAGPSSHNPISRCKTVIGLQAPPKRGQAMATRGHPSLNRHQQPNYHRSMEPQGQSSTVFIHHIKPDRRGGGLTHLV